MQTMQALALGLFPLLPVENHFCDRRHQIATRAISCDRESRGIDVDFPTLLSSPPRCGVRFFNGNRIASLRDSRGPAERCGVRAVFFLVEVTAAKLNAIAELFERGELVPHVGSVLALEQARTAHEMLAGAVHKPGKIVLKVAA